MDSNYENANDKLDDIPIEPEEDSITRSPDVNNIPVNNKSYILMNEHEEYDINSPNLNGNILRVSGLNGPLYVIACP